MCKAPMLFNPLARQPRTLLPALDNSVLILILAHQMVIIGISTVLTDWKLIIPAPVSVQIADTSGDGTREGGGWLPSPPSSTIALAWQLLYLPLLSAPDFVEHHRRVGANRTFNSPNPMSHEARILWTCIETRL